MKRKGIRLLALLLLAFALSSNAYADWCDGDVCIDDAHIGDFLKGKSWQRKAPEDTKQSDQTSRSTSEQKPQPQKQKLTLDWARAHFTEYEQRSWENPTKENIEAVMYLKRFIFDKGSNYAARSGEVLRENPLVDENNRIPYASMGQAATVKVNLEAIENATKEMADKGGVMVFVDSVCPYCKDMLQTVSHLKNYTKMPVLVVSIDGKRPRGYSESLGPLVRDNGYFRLLGLQLTPSVVYVYKPDHTKGVENNQYLIVSQGFYTLDKLEYSIAYAGYMSMRDKKEYAGLISPDTARGLDAWNKGVISSADLSRMQIDPADPGSIKRALEPYLAKQMQSKATGTKNAN